MPVARDDVGTNACIICTLSLYRRAYPCRLGSLAHHTADSELEVMARVTLLRPPQKNHDNSSQNQHQN